MIQAETVSVLWLTSPLFQAMVRERIDGLRGVKQLLAGGDVLPVESVRKYLETTGGEGELINGYGPTEGTTFSCCYRTRSLGQKVRSVPIGKPIRETLAYTRR